MNPMKSVRLDGKLEGLRAILLGTLEVQVSGQVVITSVVP